MVSGAESFSLSLFFSFSDLDSHTHTSAHANNALVQQVLTVEEKNVYCTLPLSAMPWYSFRFLIHNIGCRSGGAKKPRGQKLQIQYRNGFAKRSGSLISRHFHTKQDCQCHTLPLKRSQSMAAFLSRAAWMEGRGKK